MMLLIIFGCLTIIRHGSAETSPTAPAPTGIPTPILVSPIGENLISERNLNASIPGNNWTISLVQNEKPYAVRIRVVRDTAAKRTTNDTVVSRVDIFTPIWSPSLNVYYHESPGAIGLGPDECVDVVPSDACFLPTDGRCHKQDDIRANDFQLLYSVTSQKHDVITEAPNITITYEYTECRLKRPWQPIQISPVVGLQRWNTTITSNYWNFTLHDEGGQAYSMHLTVLHHPKSPDNSVDCTSLKSDADRYQFTCEKGGNEYLNRSLCLVVKPSSESCNRTAPECFLVFEPPDDHFEIWYNLYGNEANVTIPETDVSVMYEYRRCDDPHGWLQTTTAATTTSAATLRGSPSWIAGPILTLFVLWLE